MHHITSPDNSDASIEHLIQAKGKTAPRVIPAAIKEVVVSEHYFTAEEGLLGAIVETGTTPGWPCDDVNELIPAPLRLLTICVLVLKNGFTVTGTSACASPKNFDAEIGHRIARENAEQQIWPLLGYELKTKLANTVA